MSQVLQNDSSPTNVRHQVSAWLASGAMLAYLCRNSIAVAEKTVREDLGLSEAQMGIILGPAFFWPYALAQIPTGWLGQHFGSRRVIPLLALIWSGATVCFGFGGSALSLISSRIGMGVAQAGLFPCATQSISHWHPQTGRALANGALAAFMSVGGAIGASLTGVLLVYLDWRMTFILFGLPGIVWALVFHWWFRDFPEGHPRVNQAELEMIHEPEVSSSAAKTESISNGIDHTRRGSRHGTEYRPQPSLAVWSALVFSPAMWMISGQQFFRAAGYIFFASWFPTFLQETRGVSTSESGLLNVGPLVATVGASLLGGGLSDWMFRRTGSLNLARKGLAVISLSTCAGLVGLAYFIQDVHLAVAVISAGAFFAGFAGPCAYTVTMDLGGQHVASVFATMNMIGSFGAALLPWLVPYFRTAVERTPAVLGLVGGNSWNAVLILFAAMYALAALCWLMLNMKGTVFEQASVPQFLNRR